MGISGLEGPETPVNGGSGRNFKGSAEREIPAFWELLVSFIEKKGEARTGGVCVCVLILGILFATPTPHTRQKCEQKYGPQTAEFALF